MKYSGEKEEIKNLVGSCKSREKLVHIEVFDEPEDVPLQTSDKHSTRMLFTDDFPPQQILHMVSKNNIHHVIQYSNLNYKKNFSNTTSLIENSKNVYETPELYFLYSQSLKTIHLPIKKNANKEKISEEIKKNLDSVPKGITVKDSALIVVHELLINILYDAPKYYSVKYNAQKEFQDEEAIGKIIIAYDDQKLLLGAVDYFGSLDMNKLLNRLYETFQSDMIQVSMDPSSGAGIGCRMIFELTTEMVFSVDEGVQTFVGGCFPLGQSLKKQSLTPKNIHLLKT